MELEGLQTRPVPTYSSTSCSQTLYKRLVSVCALISTIYCAFLNFTLREFAGYQMDVSWGEILYHHWQLRHIFDNHRYEKAISPGRLCTAQAVFKQFGIVGVAMTCVITFNYSLNERAHAPVMTPVLWYMIELEFVAHLQLTSFRP